MSVGRWACSARRQADRMNANSVGNCRQKSLNCRLPRMGELTSAFGPKQTCTSALRMSAFGDKTDMAPRRVTLLPPNWIEVFRCSSGQRVSAISNDAGTLSERSHPERLWSRRFWAARPILRRRPFLFCPSCTVPTEHRGGAILWKQATDLAPFPDPWSVLLRGDRRTRDGPYFLRRTKD